MKTINLYLDMEFTSLSPDAQPISIGIVSGEVFPFKIPLADFDIKMLPEATQRHILRINPQFIECIGKEVTKDVTVACYQVGVPPKYSNIDAAFLQFFLPVQCHDSKSFYAEFNDFSLGGCDDWVKENVVKKLMFDCPVLNGATSGDMSNWEITDNITEIAANTALIKTYLSKWLSQFSDYQIQIVVDCGTFDWWFFLQLVATWDEVREQIKSTGRVLQEGGCKVGLPMLPDNISPVPLDLNDLIAIKKGIGVKEAFDMSREWLANGVFPDSPYGQVATASSMNESINNKHNALWDAKVIKCVYAKIKEL